MELPLFVQQQIEVYLYYLIFLFYHSMQVYSFVLPSASYLDLLLASIGTVNFTLPFLTSLTI